MLANTVKQIAQQFDSKWRFLSFDSTNNRLNRKDYYKVISHLCKPLLISLARLFFSIFRKFLQVSFPIIDIIDIHLHFRIFVYDALLFCRVLLLPILLSMLQVSSSLWTNCWRSRNHL
jgi:hypothetical protein